MSEPVAQVASVPAVADMSWALPIGAQVVGAVPAPYERLQEPVDQKCASNAVPVIVTVAETGALAAGERKDTGGAVPSTSTGAEVNVWVPAVSVSVWTHW